MKILDTNILIYSGERQYSALLLHYVTDSDNVVSSISKIETLGFSRITANQIHFFNNIFQIIDILAVNESIVEQAILLR